MSRAIIAALALLALSGCATTNEFQSRGFMASEIAFHTLNAIDQAQSINAISHGCFQEVNEITRGLLGPKPEASEFVLYGLAISTAFHFLNRADWVQERPALRATVNGVLIAAKGWQVAHNHSIGARMSGSNPGCEP